MAKIVGMPSSSVSSENKGTIFFLPALGRSSFNPRLLFDSMRTAEAVRTVKKGVSTKPPTAVDDQLINCDTKGSTNRDNLPHCATFDFSSFEDHHLWS
jgi:hypothetical protein